MLGEQPNVARRVSIATDHPEEVGRDVSGGEPYTASVSLRLLSNSSARDGAVIIDTGASAILVGVNWLNNRNSILRALGRPLAEHAPAFAGLRYGDGRVGDVHEAALTLIAIVGHTGQCIAYVADADIPALLGKEAPEPLGGHLTICQRVLTLEALGAEIPVEMNAVGHYPLNVANFPESQNVRTFGRRTNCCAKRVANGEGAVRSDAFFLMDVTSGAKMRPAGRGGPSPTLSCLET